MLNWISKIEEFSRSENINDIADDATQGLALGCILIVLFAAAVMLLQTL